MNPSAEKLWRDFLASGAAGPDAASAAWTAWHFGTGGQMADELAALVLAGRKRATAGALWSYERDGDPLPRTGDYSVITDASDIARCIIRTTSVEVVPFGEIGEEFAADEGEGDLSLAFWRKGHWRYFTRELASYDRVPSEGMPVVCERFVVVFPLDRAATEARGATAVRTAWTSDSPAIARLLHGLGFFPRFDAEDVRVTAARVLRHLEMCRADDSHSVWVAVDSRQEAVGYAAMHWLPYLMLPGPEGYLSELFIDERYRGLGIGTRLLDTAVEEARRRGCSRLMLTARRDRESYLRGFYAQRGWIEREHMANLVYEL